MFPILRFVLGLIWYDFSHPLKILTSVQRSMIMDSSILRKIWKIFLYDTKITDKKNFIILILVIYTYTD